MDSPVNSHASPRILVVDDDEAIRDMLALTLQRRGLHVVTARDGNDGVRIYKTQQFDVVVTDLIMPDKEGIEMILEMRQMKRPIRIIAISGGGRVDQSMHLHLARSVGADRVLSKPFMPQDLVNLIEEVMASPAREDVRHT